MQYTPGRWHHETHKTTFTLCVENFGIKYFSKDYGHHLINTVENYYNVTVDWEGKLYCGINLKWNHKKVYLNVYMDNYDRRDLHWSKTTQKYTTRTSPYGHNISQKPTPTSTAAPLDTKGKRRVQYIAGNLIYYYKIDPCIKPEQNEIPTKQSDPTKDTLSKTNMLRDYLDNYPVGILR